MNYPVYCINLKERMERKENAQKQFRQINIKPSDTIFLDFHKHKKGGIYGCYDSHMKVWNNFYQNHKDKELCIIFEDDFRATENSIYHLKKAISFIEKNKDKVDILFLHDKFIEYNDNNNKKDISNKYFIRGYGFLTHAYIITRKYIKLILDKNDNQLPKPNGIDFDIDININKKGILYSENIFFCKVPVFIQQELSSDNYHNFFDKIIRKKYGNNVMINLVEKIMKNVRFLLLKNNDEKTKKIGMSLYKLYVKQ